jgi:type III pantothenate kinase
MNSYLLIDLGNTRLKWALLRGARLGPPQAIAHQGVCTATLKRTLRSAAHKADAAAIVSVAGKPFTREIVAQLRGCGLTVRQLRSRSVQSGLRNGYAEPWRLGADRWAALLGARAATETTAPLIVVSVGTAVTIDLLDGKKNHRGGFIVPGFELMRRSLLGGTSGIARRARGSIERRKKSSKKPITFARDTDGALRAGSAHAIAGAVDQAIRAARKVTRRKPDVLLTGGGAPALQTLLRSRAARLEPALVLQGLAQFALASLRK